KCSSCWPAACPTRRSPSSWSSRAGRPPTTSSTSTPRPAPPTGRWPACSLPATGSSRTRPPGQKPTSPRERLVPGAQDPHPGDPRSFGVVVSLLLDQVVTAFPAYAYPVGDMLAVEHPAGGHRAQLGDVIPGTEPPGQDDLLHRLLTGAGLPVPSGCQGLEVQRIGQQRAQRVGVLGGQRPREALAHGRRDGIRPGLPAVSS